MKTTYKLFSVLYIYYCAGSNYVVMLRSNECHPNQVQIPGAALQLLEILEVEYRVA